MSNWLNRCHFGDVRDVLKRMAADGVKAQTIVTSPPYWGLRSYLPADHPDKAREIGSEPTLSEFLQTMVGVFDLCREVLADDGTMWVNMGDSYATGTTSNRAQTATGKHGYWENPAVNRRIHGRDIGLKPKDLIGQPWRLAFALQDAGWYLRQDIIWHKPNPMPETARDRCTKAHEYVFLLSKSERYYFDQAAIRTPLSVEIKTQSFDTMDFKARDKYKMPDGWNTGPGAHGSFHPEGREKGKPAHNSVEARKARASASHKSAPTAERNGIRSARDSFKREDSKRAQAIPGQSVGTHRPDREESAYPLDSANKRSVWTVATEAYPGSHFATFPTKLIEPCILAGAPVGGVVLDIFMGSGTTAQVAEQLGRQWIGIDLDERNAALQAERLRQPSLALEAA